MTSYRPGQYLKLLADQSAEARVIVAVQSQDEKPLKCVPVSQAAGAHQAEELESYAPAEVRAALPHEFTVLPARTLVINRTWQALADFRKLVPAEKQFEAFKEVIARFQRDERAGAEAQEALNRYITRFNEPQTPWTNWSSIVTDYLLDFMVPQSGYEVLMMALSTETQRYASSNPEAGKPE